MQQCRVLCVVNWHFFESLTTLKLHCRFHCHKPFIAIPPVEILIPECSTVGQHTLLNPESLPYRNFSSTSLLNHITLYPSPTWYELICIQHHPKLVPFWACHLFAWKTLSWITVFLTFSFVTESSHLSSLNVGMYAEHSTFPATNTNFYLCSGVHVCSGPHHLHSFSETQLLVTLCRSLFDFYERGFVLSL